MNPLEERLIESLRRKDPSPGFEQKVLSRIATQTVPRAGLWQRMLTGLTIPRYRLTTVGLTAALLISVGVAGYYQEQRKRAEGEAAKSQVMLALQIASNRLNQAQKAVLGRGNRSPSRD
jgi:hypothetical protein